MSPDRLSKLASGAISFLLLEHPYRTSLGVVLGIVIGAVLNIFAPVFENYSATIKLPTSNVLYVGCTALGILILHLPNLGRLIRRDPSVDDNLKKAFDVIDEAKKRGLSDREIRRLYLDVVERYLKNVILKEQTQQQVSQSANLVQEILSQPSDKDSKS